MVAAPRRDCGGGDGGGGDGGGHGGGDGGYGAPEGRWRPGWWDHGRRAVAILAKVAGTAERRAVVQLADRRARAGREVGEETRRRSGGRRCGGGGGKPGGFGKHGLRRKARWLALEAALRGICQRRQRARHSLHAPGAAQTSAVARDLSPTHRGGAAHQRRRSIRIRCFHHGRI